MHQWSRMGLIMAFVMAMTAWAETDVTLPRVLETTPATGSIDVDPALTEISVTFSKPMTDGNWSWAYMNKNQFPEITGQPYFMPGHTKNILPVKLEPNKEYEVWINSEKHQNFKDQAGNPAIPFRLVFKTKQ